MHWTYRVKPALPEEGHMQGIEFDGHLVGGVQFHHCDASDLMGLKIALYHHQHAFHQYKRWERYHC